MGEDLRLLCKGVKDKGADLLEKKNELIGKGEGPVPVSLCQVPVSLWIPSSLTQNSDVK